MTPEQRPWRRSGVFIVNCEHISQLFSSASVVEIFVGYILFTVSIIKKEKRNQISDNNHLKNIK